MSNNKFFNNFKGKNKKAQAGESLTWIIATLVIIAVLLAFIYISIGLGKSKAINPGRLSIKTESSVKNTDWSGIKTLLAYTINSQNKNKIDAWVNEREITSGGNE